MRSGPAALVTPRPRTTLDERDAVSNSIPPFPADIDRDAFGHWLSGFTDGEGSFLLKTGIDKRYGRRTHHALFQITLRDDDSRILGQIQAYWGCGSLSSLQRKRTKVRDWDTKPSAVFVVCGIRFLRNIIVPHFNLYPLRAKKARDFFIWKEGVDFLYQVACRQDRYSKVFRGGLDPKWTDAESDTFAAFVGALKQQRRYEAPELPLPVRKEMNDGLPLFSIHP